MSYVQIRPLYRRSPLRSHTFVYDAFGTPLGTRNSELETLLLFLRLQKNVEMFMKIGRAHV